MESTEVLIDCQSVWKVFGDRSREAIRSIAERGLTKREILQQYNCVVGVSDATLQVRRGEIFCIMGLSGSGKSTLIRHVNRLIEPTSGQIMIEGQDINLLSRDALRQVRAEKIGMVFQNMALMPHRTVMDNVAFSLEVRGRAQEERRQIAQRAIEAVDLTGWESKYPDELSGGMQQRVGLARAIAADPAILLMDEPFSALDPLIRDKLQDELLQLQDRLHKTIVFVSHDLDEALKLGSKIAIMESGRIVQAGTGEDILLRPATPYVAEFVKHMNPLNVLRGNSVMKPASSLQRQDGAVLLDPQGHVRVALDPEDRPVGCTLDGRRGRFTACNVDTGEVEDGAADLVVAPEDLRLRAAIAVKRQTDHPILLVDQLGRLAGLCDNEEIYRGLLRREAA